MQRATTSVAGAQRAHADGRDLARVRALGPDPDAGVLVDPAGAVKAEVRQRVDDHLLQPPHVSRAGARVVGHRHHWVRHELAGAVIGDVATPVGPLQHGTDGGRVDQHMRLVRVRADGEHVRVLQDQQVVVAVTARQRVLEVERFVVRDRPQATDAQHQAGPQSSAAQSRVPRSSAIRARNKDT